MSDKFKKLAVTRLLELTLFTDCDNHDADELTKLALELLKDE